MYFDIEKHTEILPEATYCLGTDEVGRGPLAGPVVSSSVQIKSSGLKWNSKLKSLHELGVTDSKKLNEKKRKELLSKMGIDFSHLKINHIYSTSLFDFVVTAVDHQIIDEMNIHHASLFAMKQGIEMLVSNRPSMSLVLVDGKWKFPVSEGISQLIVQEPIIKGDSKSLLIGVASIIAKEYRDSLMKKYDDQYPGYGLSGHSGYPTPKHKAAIAELGPSPIHRKTFKGVKEFIQLTEI